MGLNPGPAELLKKCTISSLVDAHIKRVVIYFQFIYKQLIIYT